MNKGVLPSTHYAMTENHHDGRASAFVEFPELNAWNDPGEPGSLRYLDDAPPQVWHRDVCTHPEYAEKEITIRDSQVHNVVAALRIVASETKRSRYRLNNFVAWVVETLRDGISVVVIDLFPPGPHDPHGIHKAIWDEFIDNDFALSPTKPLTLASYLARPRPEAFVEPTGVRSSLVEMPLFLSSNSYVPVPLEMTYQLSVDSMPAFCRAELNAQFDH